MTNDLDTKECRRCKQVLPLSQFGTKKSGKPKAYCLSCLEAFSREAKANMRGQPKRTHRGEDYKSRAVGLRAIGFASYREYLRSDLWKEIRSKVYAAKGRECYLCGEPATQLHHNRYHKNDLLGKKIRFINPVCDPCHEAIEFEGNEKVTLRQAASQFRRRRRKFLDGKK